MSLTRASVRIVQWMPSEEQGRTVEHIVEHSRDDQYPSLCGGPAFELVRDGDRLRCVECQRRLYRPSHGRRARIVEDPDR